MESEKVLVTSCCGSEKYAFEFGAKDDMCAICMKCGEWAGLEKEDEMPMINICEFTAFINSLPAPTAQLHSAVYHTIDLTTLTKDIGNFQDFREWWKSKNMPKHLNNTIALTILGLNPPENIKNAMLFLML